MESYVVIEGKRIELTEEQIREIRGAVSKESEYASFTKNPKGTIATYLVGGDVYLHCQVGGHGVPDALRGRCLVLGDDFEWEIIDNEGSFAFPKLLVAKRK